MKRFFLLFFAITCIGCSKEEHSTEENPKEQVGLQGKWLLVKTAHWSWSDGWIEKDLSEEEIIYHFRKDGKVKVTSISDPQGVLYEYSLEVRENPTEWLIINGNKNLYFIENGMLRFGTSYVDGADLFLERL